MKIKINKNTFLQIGKKCVMAEKCLDYNEESYICNKNQYKEDGNIRCGTLRHHFHVEI